MSEENTTTDAVVEASATEETSVTTRNETPGRRIEASSWLAE